MEPFPETPPLSAAPEGLLEGHLWLLETVEGLPLRFQFQPSGLLRFGDRTHTTDAADDLPAAYGAAIRHVCSSLDREALRAAVEHVESVDFFGVATVRRTIPYDLDRLPPFLGSDVWTADAGRFRPPDAAAGIFERLGLTPLRAIERECPARDFSADDYAAPPSAWYDGPAAGVLVRNKRGQRACLSTVESSDRPLTEPADRPLAESGGRPNAEPSDRLSNAGSTAVDSDVLESVPAEPTAETLAAAFVTDARIDAVAAEAVADGSHSVGALADQLVEHALRAWYSVLGGADPVVEPAAFRSAVATRLQRHDAV